MTRMMDTAAHPGPARIGVALRRLRDMAWLLVAAGGLAAPAAAQPAASPSRELSIEAGPIRLHGTLQTAQAVAGAEPVLILAGSGPTDRDGNSPLGVRASPYRLLAQALAERGVTSLRVDKRGIGASAAPMGSEADLRLAHFAADARLWAAALREQTGARCVWLLGHSEGVLHALLAAEQREGICGLVLVSGFGRRLDVVIAEQLRANPANAPILDEALHILAELTAGRPVPGDRVSPALAPLFRPSVQPFMIDMLSRDPADLVRSFPGPVLVVQGTTDLQTRVADAERLAGARPGVALRLVEGMNHVLKTAPADRAANFATYSNPDLPLAPGLIDPIAAFLLAN